MLATPLYDVGGIKQKLNPGDLINTMEQTFAVVDAAAHTYPGHELARGEIIRSGGAALADVLPTADGLIKALIGSLYTSPATAGFASYSTALVSEFNPSLQPIQAGSSFRRTWINNNTDVLTLTAPASSGITIAGTATIPTVNWREFIIRILNSTPTLLLIGTTANASKVLSNFNKDLINNITPGMSVYGVGIGASAKVTAVNRDAGTISVDVNSTADADNIAITFTPTVVVTTLRGGTLNN